MEPQKNYWPSGLGPRNYIWAAWAQKTYPTISPEPWLQYSQTGPHFFKNPKMNPIKFWNVKKLIDLGAWGLLETTFRPLGSRRLTLAWIFTKNRPEKTPHFIKNHKLRLMNLWNLKNYLKLRVWGIKTSFGPLGPKTLIKS